jgi:hypothetical protein
MQRTARFAIAIQRRLGLYISAAKPANDALATAGERPDWLGDAMCNAGEHSTRHHAVNRAWRDCLAAVAVGPVLLGDKQEADRYKQYNSGHVADLIQPGASAWGTDWLGETKVASPLTAASHAGRGSAANGGTVSDMGHLVAFGNTEEGLLRTVMGCSERGRPADGPLDHTTGRGWVAFHKGDYHDARFNKNNQVTLLLVECFGGIARHGARSLRFFARRARDVKRGRDGTRYSRWHASSFLSHHTAAIVGAAVFTDAAHIEDEIVHLKQRAFGAASASA